MPKFNLRINPTPHGLYNRTKAIILCLLEYCRVELGMNSGLPMVQIANIVSVHGVDYDTTRNSVCRYHGFHLLSRRPKSTPRGMPKYAYTISSDGDRWLNKWVPEEMKRQILAPMIPKLNNSSNDIKGLFG